MYDGCCSLCNFETRKKNDCESCLFPAIERTCDNGEVRLVGGGTLLEGRVEVCYNSRWGTVCDNMWDRRDARVVCRQVAGEYGLEYDDFFSKSLL